MISGKILCSLSEEICVIKMVGRIQYLISLDLGLLMKRLASNPPKTCIVDLTDTTYMDSTSLGVVAGIKTLEYRSNIKMVSQIYSTNRFVTDIIKSVGLQTIFDIKETAPSFITKEIKEFSTTEIAEYETREIFLDAHKELCAINQENSMTFCDVVKLLEGESPLEQFRELVFN